MDVLNLNPLQGGATAASGTATDAPVPGDAPNGSDFAALLALGLNFPSQDTAQPPLPEEIKAETAIVADAQTSLSVPELIIALPQQASNADTLVKSTASTLVAAQAEQPLLAAKAAQTPLAAAADRREATPAAVVADAPANIAASGAHTAQSADLHSAAQNVDQHANNTTDPNFKPDVAFDALRSHASDLAPRADSPSHAFTIHPTETRAALSQPSALLEVQAPVSEPGFAQALSRQVVWMVDKDAQVAELRINPPELGPVEVRLTLTQDSAAAEFVSPHAEVRTAIENAIVRLREAMAEAGIQLGEASVSAESFSQRAGTQSESRHSDGGYRETAAGESAARPIVRSMTPQRGLVDVFA